MNKKRLYFSKEFKRLAIIEIINGKSLETILRDNNFDIDELLEKDKKYCLKLLHKWRNEVYKNNEYMYFLNNKINKNILLSEIKLLKYENEDDVIIGNEKEKMKRTLEKHKNFKNII